LKYIINQFQSIITHKKNGKNSPQVA